MESYLNKISNYCSNPFIVGIVIVIALNFIIIFVSPRLKNGNISSKRLFRSTFYQYIIITFILYIHHNRVHNEYKQKYESELKLDLVSKTGSKEDRIEPDLKTEITPEINNNIEDEFI